MNRPFLLFVCVLFIGKAFAQNSPLLFRDGGAKSFVVEKGEAARNGLTDLIHLRSATYPDQQFESSSRIALQLRPGKELGAVLGKKALELIQEVNQTTFILQAGSADAALEIAQELSKHPDVANCIPVMRSLSLGLQGPLAAVPNDPLFTNLWHLENKTFPGIDLNARGGWAVSRGDSVIIGVADQAVNVAHPDLASRAVAGYHFNFIDNTPNLGLTDKDQHGTAVTGLAVAEMNNSKGVAGVAPSSRFVSWRIFSTNGAITDDQGLMNMFQYRSNVVAVQNHSWASTSRSPYHVGFLSRLGIDEAIAKGRLGRGVVMVRSAGNRRLGGLEGVIYRDFLGNANDDGFCTDPNVIVVAAARADGRVAHYSNPGANLLVAGLSNESLTNDTATIDTAFPALTTTAANGSYTNLTGTSGSVPQISGIVSLILAVNPTLTYRDVQQVLLLSSRHYDMSDPSVRVNGAGLRVSHNLGYGIPDAAVAVGLAKTWKNRPVRQLRTYVSEEQKTIPDQGFVVRVTGENVPGELAAIPALMPKEGYHPDISPGELYRPDSPTAERPMVYVGQATGAIAENLTGKIALIQRGGASFYEKVKRAQDAGAEAAIVFDNQSGSLVLMSMTNWVGIPSTFISQTAGEALVNQSQNNPAARAQLRLNPATYSFNVTDPLALEHVSVKIRTDNIRRSDVRITLTSPSGTRSILQRANADPSTNAPIDWTYLSTQHFYESSVGTWTLQITDEVAGAESFAYHVELQLYGVALTDSDADGLDDAWETAKFGSLAANASADPDGDGFSNAQENILDTNPLVPNTPIITQQPRHWPTSIGATVSFSVKANGIAPLYYQWKLNGNNIRGATRSVLTLSNLRANQAGAYTVEVSNFAGSTLSSNAYLGFYACRYGSSVSQTNFPSTGGIRSISILASNACSWKVTSSIDWIAFNSPTNGTGAGTLQFTVAANLGMPRKGTIVVAGKNYLLSQDGEYLPENLRGKDLLIDSIPEGSAHFSFSTDGTTGKLKTFGEVITQYSYTRDNSGVAVITMPQGELRLDFHNGASGSFQFLNQTSNPSSGSFLFGESGPDFNGDFYRDLLFQGSDRSLTTWLLAPSLALSTNLHGGAPATVGWRAVGASDFDLDGHTDVLFQNGTRHAVWFMDRLAQDRVQFLQTPSLPTAWKTVALGDFNDDGKQEIVLRNGSNGRMTAWFIETNKVVRSAAFTKPIPLAWRVFAATDINGDRKTDLLAQHTTSRRIVAWLCDGTTVGATASIGDGQVPSVGWKALGVGDLENDMKNDIIFQTSDGTISAWYLFNTVFHDIEPIRSGIVPDSNGRLVAPN